VIPLPRPWLLTSAMLLGVAVGLLGGAAAIALVVGFPSAVGLLVILMARRQWLTALGAFVLALAPGYFGVLALVEVVTRG
jgi:ABC-type nickel/cobalt efflux system permease component RcnA